MFIDLLTTDTALNQTKHEKPQPPKWGGPKPSKKGSNPQHWRIQNFKFGNMRPISCSLSRYTKNWLISKDAVSIRHKKSWWADLGKAEEELAAGLEAVDGVDSLVYLVVQGLDLLLAGSGQQEVVHLGLERVVHLKARAHHNLQQQKIYEYP